MRVSGKNHHQAHEASRRDERERIRQRERERLGKTEKVSLRQTPKQLVSKVVDDFNLTKWLAQESALEKLVMAGYRGHAPYVTFLFAARSRRSSCSSAPCSTSS